MRQHAFFGDIYIKVIHLGCGKAARVTTERRAKPDAALMPLPGQGIMVAEPAGAAEDWTALVRIIPNKQPAPS